MNPDKSLESTIQSLINTAVEKHQLGQLDKAESIYRQVLQIQLDPGAEPSSTGNRYHPIVIVKLGNILRDQGQLDEAVIFYQQAINIKPDFAEAHNNLGNILQDQGQLEAAMESYQQALKIKPNFAKAYYNLGNVLKQQGQLEAAIKSYQQAINIKPDFAKAHNNLGNILQDQGQLEAAMKSYQQAINIKPDFAQAKFCICMNQLRIIYSSFAEIKLRRNNYQQHLQNLAQSYQIAHPKERAKAAEVVGSIQPFYLAYQGLNNRDLQQTYGAMACQLMASRYPQWSQPIPLPTLEANEKIRVGIVSGFFWNHSNWKIPIKGWVENLDRNEFELFGYHTGSREDEETPKAARAFVKFIQGPLSLEQWCEVIEQDQLHILIFPEFGMHPMTIRLGCLRLAPIQIGSPLGHADTSGLPTIDYYLSSDLMEPENAQDHYTEKLVRLPNLAIYYTLLPIRPKAISKKEIGIENDEVMFWCCQSLFKYLPQHDDVFPRIARELASSKFVFLANSSEPATEVFRQRLSRAFQEFGLDYRDHCIILPPGWDSSSFAGTTALADISLDSIGWSGGNTGIECIACNVPVVTLPGNLMRGRMTMAFLKMMGIEEIIAASKEDYVQIAIRLGQDRQYRQHISRRLAENKHKLYGDLEPIKALEDFLLNAVHKKRRSSTATAFETLQLPIQHPQASRLAQAEQAYRKILETQPNHPEALLGLGVLAQQRGEYQAAEHWLSAALRVQPDSVKGWFSLGNLRQAQGHLPEAVEAYQRALAIQPDLAAIHNNFGYVLQQQGKIEAAIACYQKALEIQPDYVGAYVNRGNALYAQGKLSREKQAHYAAANYMLGVTRQKEGYLTTAVAYYRQAILMQPDLAIAHYNLGVALEKQGQLEEALTCYQKALELNPGNAKVYDHLGKIYQAL